MQSVTHSFTTLTITHNGASALSSQNWSTFFGLCPLPQIVFFALESTKSYKKYLNVSSRVDKEQSELTVNKSQALILLGQSQYIRSHNCLKKPSILHWTGLHAVNSDRWKLWRDVARWATFFNSKRYKSITKQHATIIQKWLYRKINSPYYTIHFISC